MKYYLTFTDTNSRQYIYEITESGIPVKSPRGVSVVTQSEPNLDFMFNAIRENHPLVINGNSIFSAQHIVAIQIQQYQDESSNDVPVIEVEVPSETQE